MGKAQLGILVGFLIALVAALCLKAPHWSAVDKEATLIGTSVGGSGPPDNSRTVPANLPKNSEPAETSQPATPRVIAGGAGAGRAPIRNSFKPESNPGVPEGVLQAAQAGLPFFLEKIPPGSKELYGFSMNDDLSRAQLGQGLRMHAITPTALMKASSTANVSSILSDTSMWFFPILLESDAKAMLVVDRDGDSWKAVSLGYAALGHELNQVLGQWPESKGFHPQLIAAFQAKQYYFTVPEMDDFNLTPIRLRQEGLAQGAMTSGNTYAQLGRAVENLEALRPIVAKAEQYQAR